MHSETALRYAIEHANGWVIRNLKETYCSMLPDSLITCQDDIRIGEKLLSCIMGHPVIIRSTSIGYICEL